VVALLFDVELSVLGAAVPLVSVEGVPDVVWATATAPSAKAPATPARVAIFMCRDSYLG
jgi:hypothetical protein